MKTNSFAAWVLAVRPYSLGNSVILAVVGSALACTGGGFKPIAALLCLLFAVLMQCTANLVNDLWDFLKGADRPDRLGPDRAFAKGYITPRAMKQGIAGFTAAAIVTGCALLAWALHHGTLRFGGWELVAAGVLCLLFAYLYTAGPWPLAYHGLGDVAVVLFFGLVPVGFTCYIQTGSWDFDVTAAALACGLAIDTMLMINNFRDREEDAHCGKRTLVVTWGARAGKWGYLLLGVAAVALCIPLGLDSRPWTPLMLLPYLVAHVATWRKMVRIDHGEELNVCLGETARNIMLFGALLTLEIIVAR